LARAVEVAVVLILLQPEVVVVEAAVPTLEVYMMPTHYQPH
jgi:hypothetical protein